MLVIQNFINGKFIDGKSLIDSFDPSNGKIYAQVPDSNKEEVDLAVSAAKGAFPGFVFFQSFKLVEILCHIKICFFFLV